MDHTAQSLWDSLTTAALVGIERKPAPLPATGGPLGAVLGAIAAREAEPEAKLLASAAAVAAYRRAGARPAVEETPPPLPCPPDDRPPTSARSSLHLREMLDGPYRAALPEWLAEAARLGRRVRDADLVPLLEHGRAHPDLREPIRAVIGERGRWLAAQNPDWGFAAGAAVPEEADWQTGNREARLALLKRLRLPDPARGRETLVATWSQETHADRAAFLAALEVGLSMDDEPFLEAALDDPRAEVRKAAADLLGRLAGSRLVGRMIERVRPLVRFSGDGSTLAVDITLPDAHTKDMARDGIAKTRPGMGERNAWLSQMIPVVPPAHWTTGSGRTPAELLDSALRSEWELVLTWGWTEAAERHCDQDWLEALALAALARDDWNGLRRCLDPIEGGRRQRLLMDTLAGGVPLLGHTLYAIVAAMPAPWDVPFSRDVADRIARGLQVADRAPDPSLAMVLRLAGVRVAPSLREELEGLFPLDDPSSPPLVLKPIQEFLDTVRFRQQALAELSS
jgi:hypothetical protein